MPEIQSTRRAVFFDRDGVLNEETHYVRNLGQLRIYPQAAEAVRAVNQAGWLAIVVTNQAGVARGYMDETMVQSIHVHFASWLADRGARLDAIYYCPHHPEHGAPPYRQACDCRKPRPGMLLRAAREHRLDLPASILITDRYAEVAMMQALGGRAALVLTGYGQGDWERARQAGAPAPDWVSGDVLAAIHAIAPALQPATP